MFPDPFDLDDLRPLLRVLREALQRGQPSPVELAALLRRSPSHARNLASGERALTPALAADLGRALGCERPGVERIVRLARRDALLRQLRTRRGPDREALQADLARLEEALAADRARQAAALARGDRPAPAAPEGARDDWLALALPAARAAHPHLGPAALLRRLWPACSPSSRRLAMARSAPQAEVVADRNPGDPARRAAHQVALQRAAHGVYTLPLAHRETTGLLWRVPARRRRWLRRRVARALARLLDEARALGGAPDRALQVGAWAWPLGLRVGGGLAEDPGCAMEDEELHDPWERRMPSGVDRYGVRVMAYGSMASYLDAVLRRFLDRRTANQPAGLARLLGFDRGGTAVLRGARPVPPERVAGMVDWLQLQASDADFFRTLALLQRARSEPERARLRGRLAALRGDRGVAAPEDDSLLLFRAWHTLPVLELLAIDDAPDDPDALAGLLRPPVEPDDVYDDLRLLDRLGLIARDGGRWRPTRAEFAVPAEIFDTIVADQWYDLISLARRSLFDASDGDDEGVPFGLLRCVALSREGVEAVTQGLRALVEDLSRELEESARAERCDEIVYVLFDAHPITTPAPGPG